MEEIAVNGNVSDVVVDSQKLFPVEELIISNKHVNNESLTNGNGALENHLTNGNAKDDTNTENVTNGVEVGEEKQNIEELDEVHVDVEECRDEDNVPLLKLAAQIKLRMTPEREIKDNDSANEENKLDDTVGKAEDKQLPDEEIIQDDDDEEDDDERASLEVNVDDCDKLEAESTETMNSADSSDTITIPKCTLPTEKFSSVMQDISETSQEINTQDVTSSKLTPDNDSSVSGSNQSTPEKKVVQTNYNISGRRPIRTRTPKRSAQESPQSEPAKLNWSPLKRNKSLQKYETKNNLNVAESPGPSKNILDLQPTEENDEQVNNRKRRSSQEPDDVNPEKRIKSEDNRSTFVQWITSPLSMIKKKFTSDKTETENNMQVVPYKGESKQGTSCLIM